MGYKVREAVRIVEQDGWRRVATRGSHRQFKHPVKLGKVTISGNSGDDMPIWRWNSVMRQAGLKG